MNADLKTPLRVAAWTASGLLVLGIGAGAAEAVGTHRSAPPAQLAAVQAADPTTGAAAPGALARRGALLRRAVHGELTVRTQDGYQTLLVQRGTLSAVNATSITVHSPDGFEATYTVDKNTKIRLDRQTASIGSLKTGDRLIVVAVKGTGNPTAKRIAATDRRPAGATPGGQAPSRTSGTSTTS